MNYPSNSLSRLPRWGIVISALYSLMLAIFLLPAGLLIAGRSLQEVPQSVVDMYRVWLTWILIGTILACEAALFFVSVDSSRTRLRPRHHVFVSVAITAWLFALLTYAVTWCVAVALLGDHTGKTFDRVMAGTPLTTLGWWIGLWVLWGWAFFTYFRGHPEPVSKAVSWLLRGSVLELLIAVPSHVIVRQRGDCSAPFVTGFGIATGIAIMLIAFGPSVLFLYLKRLGYYKTRTTRGGPRHDTQLSPGDLDTK